MRTIHIVFMSAIIFLGGCKYPTSEVMQGGSNGSLYFPQAMAGVRVILDGVDVGDASVYDGQRSVLGVSPGSHRVVLRQGMTTSYDRQIYVGDGARMAIGGP